MKRCFALIAAFVIVVALAAGCGTKDTTSTQTPVAATPAKAAPAGQTNIAIDVPCGMLIPFKTVIAEYKKTHRDVAFTEKYDNAGVLVKDIVNNGAKCDLFVSPGSTELNTLASKGKADAATKKAVGKYELVVIVPHGNPQNIQKPEDLLKLKTLSIPDPDINSVGAFGKQALTKLGLWDKLQDKFVRPFPEHAIDSHTMVANGKSQAGISYKNCPLETNPEKLDKSKVAVAFSIDPTTYDAAECLVAIMSDSPVRTQAQAFIDYLLTPDAQKILVDKGLTGIGS
jgi:molybdate transport system substrate-binding protein